MPKIDLSMLNQRQTPAFYADVLANRPAAGFIGRIFVSTNTYAFYRDNGTGWDLIGGPGTGTVTGSGTAGQVTYWDGASSITGSNNLFWDSAAGHLGINNNTPGTGLDVHDSQSTILQLNQTTATNDTRIAFQNAGTSLWRIGNFYNAGANDWGIYDVVGAAQRLTVKKTTGQVLIGTSTVGSGKLVVASASSDNGIQIVGAIAPSLRIDSAETGATKRIGIGLATAVNNFIQNSQNLDMCIFNGSTSAAGNMLFGIYDTGLTNVQEAARISAARNFLIGTIVDAGQKLQVSGTSLITGAATFSSSVNLGTIANSGDLSLLNIKQSSTAYNNGIYIERGGERNGYYMYIGGAVDSLTFRRNYFGTQSDVVALTRDGNVGFNTTSPTTYGLAGSHIENFGGANYCFINNNTNSVKSFFAANEPNLLAALFTFSNHPLTFGTNNTERGRFSNSGNLLIGTTTDAGQKLQVNGNAVINNGYLNVSGNTNSFKQGITSILGQDAGAVTLSTIFSNIDFSSTVDIALQLQIIATTGAAGNSTAYIYNCVRDDANNWTSLLVSQVGTVQTVTLTFGGTQAAPTLTITGTPTYKSVYYQILIR